MYYIQWQPLHNYCLLLQSHQCQQWSRYHHLLCAVFNKSWKQHPTKQQLYGHLPPISKTIQVRQTRHIEHCRRSKNKLISDVLIWTPTHGHTSLGTMDDRNGWQENVRELCCYCNLIMIILSSLFTFYYFSCYFLIILFILLSYFNSYSISSIFKNKKFAFNKCKSFKLSWQKIITISIFILRISK